MHGSSYVSCCPSTAPRRGCLKPGLQIISSAVADRAGCIKGRVLRVSAGGECQEGSPAAGDQFSPWLPAGVRCLSWTPSAPLNTTHARPSLNRTWPGSGWAMTPTQVPYTISQAAPRLQYHYRRLPGLNTAQAEGQAQVRGVTFRCSHCILGHWPLADRTSPKPLPLPPRPATVSSGCLPQWGLGSPWRTRASLDGLPAGFGAGPGSHRGTAPTAGIDHCWQAEITLTRWWRRQWIPSSL